MFTAIGNAGHVSMRGTLVFSCHFVNIGPMYKPKQKVKKNLVLAIAIKYYTFAFLYSSLNLFEAYDGGELNSCQRTTESILLDKQAVMEREIAQSHSRL